MSEDPCPNPKTLSDLLLGRLPAEQAEPLEAHVLRCTTCANVVESIDVEDPVTAGFAVWPSRRPEETELRAAIEQAYEIRSRISTVDGEETSISSNAKAPESVQAIIDALRPAQEVDELGRLADYRVLKVVGCGGMGVVFLAEDTQLRRRVAIKAMKPEVAARPSARQRFLREAQAIAALEHDNVVTIHQVGEDNGIPFIAMQYLKGESLRSRLDREEKLTEEDAIRVVSDVAAGLSVAHELGLIHRDIKPGNIWIEEGTGRAKVLDFGLARSNRDGDLTQTGAIVGTPKYMSPEQALGELVDKRSDLFSLGSVLYHSLVGRPPFTGKSVTGLLMAVAKAEYQPVEKASPTIHPYIARIVGSLLSREPAARPPSAAVLVEDLHALEAGSKTREIVASGLSSRGLRASLAIAAAVAGLTMLALWGTGVLFRVESPNGTLVVKVNSSDFESTVKGQQVVVRDRKTGQRYTIDLDTPTLRQPLKPGNYEFLLQTGSGLRTTTDRFEIVRGNNKVVEVTFEPNSRVKAVADARRLTVAKDGTAHFDTISAALAAAKPGTTVTVVDDGVYSERVVVDSDRLRKVTLRATSKATILAPGDGSAAVSLLGTPDFRLDGFRIKEDTSFGQVHPLILVRQDASGVRLQNLTIEPNGYGVGLIASGVSCRRPMHIKSCSVKGGAGGILLDSGRGVRIETNRVERCSEGIQISGRINDVLVAGNSILNASGGGIDVEDLSSDSGHVLITNNTIHGADLSLRLIDYAPLDARKKNAVQIVNNVFAAVSIADAVFFEDDVESDGANVMADWLFQGNYRDLGGLESDKALPHSDSNRKLEAGSLSRMPNGLWRPKSRDLVRAFATDLGLPKLPDYAGAVPADNEAEWNWDSTWGRTVTVSKDGSGQYETITDALNEATPGTTIEVKDTGVYAEALRISSADLAGVTLRSENQATIEASGDGTPAVTITDVPDFTFEGFRVTESRAIDQLHPLIYVKRNTSGVRLKKLRVEARGYAIGVLFAGVDNTEPSFLSDCFISGGARGIGLDTARNVRIENNRVDLCFEGLQVSGVAQRVQIVGNSITNQEISGIDIEDLERGSSEVLIANNTLYKAEHSLRIVDYPPAEEYERGAVTVTNNVCSHASLASATFFAGESPADGSRVLDKWVFQGNYRDLSGAKPNDELSMSDKNPRLTGEELTELAGGLFGPATASHLKRVEVKGKDLPPTTIRGRFATGPGGKKWNWDRTWQRQ